MPRYLRWIAAATTGLVVQFGLFVALGALIVGADPDEDVTQITGASGILVAFVAPILPMVIALAVNDWLATRYPKGSQP